MQPSPLLCAFMTRLNPALTTSDFLPSILSAEMEPKFWQEEKRGDGPTNNWGLSPDGKYLATMKSGPYDERVLQIFNLADGTEKAIPLPRNGLTMGMDWAADSKSIWLGGFMGRGAWGTRSGILNVDLHGNVTVALEGFNPEIWWLFPRPTAAASPFWEIRRLQRLVAGKLLEQKAAFHFTVEDGITVEIDVVTDPEHIRERDSQPSASPKRYAPPETSSNGASGADLRTRFVIRTRFVHNVEWCFGGAAEAAESGGRHHVTNAALAGLRAQTQSNFLGP